MGRDLGSTLGLARVRIRAQLLTSCRCSYKNKKKVRNLKSYGEIPIGVSQCRQMSVSKHSVTHVSKSKASHTDWSSSERAWHLPFSARFHREVHVAIRFHRVRGELDLAYHVTTVSHSKQIEWGLSSENPYCLL